jgi:hypothetical protein
LVNAVAWLSRRESPASRACDLSQLFEIKRDLLTGIARKEFS